MSITVIVNPPAVIQLDVNISRSVTWDAISGKPDIAEFLTVTTEEAFLSAQSGAKKIITYGDREYYWNGTELKYMATYSPAPETTEEEIDGNV